MSRDEHRDGVGQDPEKTSRLARTAAQTQLDFELDFFEGILDRNPDYVDVLKVHGNNLIAKGLYRDGLNADRRLVRLKPRDAAAHYNLACSYSLLGHADNAFAALESSLRLGYRDFEHLLCDPDLEYIRSDGRFMGLVCRFMKAL